MVINLKLKELLKKFKVDVDLSEDVLGLEIDGVYDDMVETKVFLDSFTKQGFVKQEYGAYKFSGDGCECFVAPLSKIRTVSCYYKKEGFSYGYCFDCYGVLRCMV